MPSGVSANYRYKLLVEGNCYKYKLRSEIVEKFKIPLNMINLLLLKLMNLYLNYILFNRGVSVFFHKG